MLDYRRLTTARLTMAPVAPGDLAHLVALKADPRAFGMMLGGVRSKLKVMEELEEDIRLWGKLGLGIWTLRERRAESGSVPGGTSGRFLGIAGFMERSDGLGIALRFAVWPEARGAGIAREAAGAALFFAHETVGISRIVAIAREDNFASRTVLGSIGMVEESQFDRHGVRLLVYVSVRQPKSR
jgi:RimJ/RimL family protein N-acetyltransferase